MGKPCVGINIRELKSFLNYFYYYGAFYQKKIIIKKYIEYRQEHCSHKYITYKNKKICKLCGKLKKNK